jgi:hypothetical protein
MIFLKNKLHFSSLTYLMHKMYQGCCRNASVLTLLILIAPNVKATRINSKQLNFQEANSQELQICPSPNLRTTRSFVTDKYHVYICRGERAGSLGYYVRMLKLENSKITIPVSHKNGENYIATNKDGIAYAINPYQSMVIKKGRVILKEKVNSATKGDGSILVAGCPQGENTIVEAETKSFILYICGAETPSSYIAITKKGNEKLILPLLGYNFPGEANNQQYLATNGDLFHFLTYDSLRISLNGETIVTEKVLRWN